MPHVIVKMLTGRSQAQKAELADEITKAVMAVAHCDETAVSVAIEDVEAADWTKAVYNPDIKENWANLYKKPGYEPS